MRKIYVNFVELGMKLTVLSALKGSNYNKNVKDHRILGSNRDVQMVCLALFC